MKLVEEKQRIRRKTGDKRIEEPRKIVVSNE